MNTIRFNHEAERAVLGGVLVFREGVTVARTVLADDGSDFHEQHHAAMWRAMVSLDVQRIVIDEVTLGEELRRQERENVVRFSVSIEQLRFHAAKSWQRIDAHARIIADLAMARRVERAGEHVMLKSSDPSVSPIELAAFATREVTSAAQRRDITEPKSIADITLEYFEDIEAAANRGRAIAGFRTGIQRLDVMIGGYERGKLYIIAARPAMGKSALAGKASRTVAEDEHEPSLFFSCEMPRKQVIERMVCEEAGVDSRDAKVPTPAILGMLSAASQRLFALPVYIDDDPRVTTADIRARALAMKNRGGLGVVIVDYLTKVKSPPGMQRNRSRENEVKDIAEELKAIAKELDVAVIALAQLNRDCEDRPDKRPMLSDLRESGQIEQEADVVLFLYRDEYYRREHSDSPGLVEIIVAKQRGGATGTVEARFIKHLTRFEDISAEEVAAIRETHAPPTTGNGRFRRPA